MVAHRIHLGGGVRRKNKALTESPAVIVQQLESEVAVREDVNNASAALALPVDSPVTKEREIMIRLDEPGQEDFEHMGDLLVYLRKSYFDRIAPEGQDRPHIELKAAAVVDYLRRHRYSMTSGSFSQLEQGKTLPRNPEQFLDIICACLNIDPTSKYYVLLRRQYIYDHAVRFVGRKYADQSILHGSELLKSLREKAAAAGAPL